MWGESHYRNECKLGPNHTKVVAFQTKKVERKIKKLKRMGFQPQAVGENEKSGSSELESELAWPYCGLYQTSCRGDGKITVRDVAVYLGSKGGHV